MNKYTGEVPVRIGDKDCTIVFNWRAIAEIKSTIGLDKLSGLGSSQNMEDVADLMLIGLKTRNPEVTKDMILSAPLPLLPTINMLQEAIGFAIFGPDGPPEDNPADKPPEDSAEKKT